MPNSCFASVLSSVLIFIYSAPSGHSSSVVPCSMSGTAGLKQTKGPCYTSSYTPCNTSLTFAKQKQQKRSLCRLNKGFIFQSSLKNIIERHEILRIRVINLKIATFLLLTVFCSDVGEPRQMFYETGDVSEVFLRSILVSSYIKLEEDHWPLLSV